MRTLQIKTLEAVEGVFPQSNKNNIRFIKQGDGSGTISITLLVTSANAANPIVLSIKGGVFILENDEEATEISVTVTTQRTYIVRADSDDAFISFDKIAFWVRENNATRTENSPYIDYSEPFYRFMQYISLLSDSPFNLPIDGLGYNTRVVTAYTSMFNGAINFNQDVSFLDTAGATLMDNMFKNARQFNQDISHWDVSSVSNMFGMFSGARSFNQDLSNWSFHLNVNLTAFMDNSGLSPENYSKLLINLAAKDWTGRTATKNLGASGVRYNSDGVDARAALVAGGWTIIDGGQS